MGEIIILVRYGQIVKLQTIKYVRIIKNVPLQDHVTPHYANISLLKYLDIVKLHICLFFYDHIHNGKPNMYILYYH